MQKFPINPCSHISIFIHYLDKVSQKVYPLNMLYIKLFQIQCFWTHFLLLNDGTKQATICTAAVESNNSVPAQFSPEPETTDHTVFCQTLTPENSLCLMKYYRVQNKDDGRLNIEPFNFILQCDSCFSFNSGLKTHLTVFIRINGR